MDNANIVLSSPNMLTVFERFEELHHKYGRPFERFSDKGAYIYDEEQYKERIYHRAQEILIEPKVSMLDRVIRAIEQKENNLLHWPAIRGEASRIHRPLIEALEAPAKRDAVEAALRNLYERGQATESTFEELVKLCGGRYELLAYLFFISDRTRFLPVRVKTFEHFFEMIGTPLAMSRKCSWQNYEAFIARMRAVESWLRDQGVPDANLLHAHSFAWVVARDSKKSGAARPAETIRLEPFSGFLKHIEDVGKKIPRFDGSVVDTEQQVARRIASGARAEARALESERERLRIGGRPDLASKVEPVGHRPGLGFDISSFELTGAERVIEVKNVSSGTGFHVTENEWLRSRSHSNYWFYLVDLRSGREVIQVLSAKAVLESHLVPTQFFVNIGKSGS